jgi:predicted  nucleic acid-binding Zn-ribbon protein
MADIEVYASMREELERSWKEKVERIRELRVLVSEVDELSCDVSLMNISNIRTKNSLIDLQFDAGKWQKWLNRYANDMKTNERRQEQLVIDRARIQQKELDLEQKQKEIEATKSRIESMKREIESGEAKLKAFEARVIESESILERTEESLQIS